jgi:hypothetical protein
MIHLATSFKDIEDTINLLQQFLKDTAYSRYDIPMDREHLGRMCSHVQKSGYIWIARKAGLPVGILMAVVEPNMWAPQHRQMRELVFYVDPQHRGLISGRLFLKYCDQGDLLIKQGVIDAYFTSKMSTTTNYNLVNRGFRLTEQTYIKEK